jgi:hypothetical protein
MRELLDLHKEADNGECCPWLGAAPSFKLEKMARSN